MLWPRSRRQGQGRNDQRSVRPLFSPSNDRERGVTLKLTSLLSDSSYITISLPPTRSHTPTVKRTLNPDFPSKDSTFDFPLVGSSLARLGSFEIVCWDKVSRLV